MKNYRITISLLAVLFFIVSSSFSNKEIPIDETSDFGGWVKLGKQIVSPGVDHDELDVTEAEKAFKLLKFKVLKAPMYIRTIKIVYGDGTSESHIITRQFRKGSASRILDLSGHGRIIKKVVFSYKTRTSGRVQAQMVVMAKF